MPASSLLHVNHEGRSQPETSALHAAAHNALRHYQQLLVEKLNVRDIIGSLRRDPAQIVTTSEYERLNALTDKNAQAVTMLVAVLKSKTQLQWNAFLSILRQRDYLDIANKLGNYAPSADAILARGGVPTFSNLLRRDENVRRVHEALRQAASARNPTRVLLIYGKPGMGKTCLAAEALRTCPKLCSLYEHGVVWCGAGHIRDEKRANVDEPVRQLMEDILKFPALEAAVALANATRGQQPQTTFRQVKEQLRNALLHCRILLALDDVWSEDVLKAFAGMRITIVSTSRNRLAVKQQTTSAVRELEVKPCSPKESDAIVRSICPIESKTTMQRVTDRCQGVPIALNGVATLLRGKSAEEQLLLLDKLDSSSSGVTAVKVPRSEHKYFDQVLEASLRDLEQADDLQVGPASLSGDDMQQRYLDLSVLDDGEPLFADKLAVLLCADTKSLLPPKHVDQLLANWEKRSLLTKTGQTHWKSKQDIYTLHDIQLDYLRVRAADPATGSLTAHHKQWVSGFLAARRLGDVLDADDDSDTAKRRSCCSCGGKGLRFLRKRRSASKRQTADNSDTIQWSNLSKVIRNVAFGGKWWPCFDAYSSIVLDGSDEERHVMLQFVNEKDELQWSPLHAAAYAGNLKVAELLLKQRAEVNACTEKRETPLHFAAQNGHFDVVELLIKQQADVKAATAQKITPLHLAAQNGHRNIVELLLAQHADVNARTEKRYTPLHLAAQGGHRDVAELLLANSADVNALTSQQLTPLHLASQNGHRSVVELLLTQPTDVNALAVQQLTPLHLASMNGHRTVAELLLKHKAVIKARTTQQFTPLHLASQNGHRELAELLLKSGADVRAQTVHRQTALYLASENGHRDVVDLLLAYYADVHARCEDHVMPLHIASQNGHRDVVELLLKCHANIRALMAEQFTSLHLAAQDGHRDVAELLLRQNADVNALTTKQFTPLHLAAQNGHRNVAELLLSYRATINAPAAEQFTPLHLAAQDGHRDVAELLLKAGADIGARTVHKFTPLHIASQNGHHDVAELLLMSGADINARTGQLFTPLHLALQDGYLDLTHLLLSHRADINARTAQLFTPLHLAAQDGHRDVASLLLANGADVNAETEKRSTPLHFACLYGHLDVAQLLLDHHADISVLNLFGCTPMSFAQLNKHGPIISLLQSRAAA